MSKTARDFLDNEEWKCIQCGACCKIAGWVDSTLALDPGNPTCKYLEDNKCTIYDERPDICRTENYPAPESVKAKYCAEVYNFIHDREEA